MKHFRTLDLVEAKVREGGKYNLTQFTVHQLISPANIELIGRYIHVHCMIHNSCISILVDKNNILMQGKHLTETIRFLTFYKMIIIYIRLTVLKGTAIIKRIFFKLFFQEQCFT